MANNGCGAVPVKALSTSVTYLSTFRHQTTNTGKFPMLTLPVVSLFVGAYLISFII